ncbi:hypothetical protein K443DRAFT_126239 [Laccaria amethystina LaAM-08-1]|uniref:Uncharacterized protein n=1 Tax=Laccaria amethystina LaAM-08-1 TaxID=1095629 RepID=A0A0C9X1F9_9AGAR|nr:hypothetical protein K443DRAFT_126239 [Laccaria amethystina LaAM-08-1]
MVLKVTRQCGSSLLTRQQTPQLASPSTPARPPSHTFGTDVTQATVNVNTNTQPPVSAGKCAPKSSGISQEAINKACLNIEKVLQKCTLLDTLLEVQEKNNKMWSDEAKEKLLIQK